jgi:hypothetical protein
MNSRFGRYLPAAALVTAVLLTAVLLVLPTIATLVGLAAPWVAAAGWWLASNWNNVERVLGRGLSVFGGLHANIDMASSAAVVQGVINGGRSEIEAELPGVMPAKARVRFVRGEEDLVAIGDGEVVITMKPSRNHGENTARATLAYVTSTARSARPYVDPRAMRSIDYSMTRRVLGDTNRAALDYLLNVLWVPAISGDAKLKRLCEMVQAIEEEGWLTRILLREYIDLGRRLYPKLPPPLSHEASIAFVEHLYRLATRKKGEKFPNGLSFRQGPMKVGVVFVAAIETSQSMGLVPHIRRCIEHARAGSDSVYLLALGGRRPDVRRIIEQLTARGLIMGIDETHYTVKREGRTVDATMARLAFTDRARAIGGSNSGRPAWRRGHRRQAKTA